MSLSRVLFGEIDDGFLPTGEFRSFSVKRKIFFLFTSLLIFVMVFTTLALSGRENLNVINKVISILAGMSCLIYCCLFGKIKLGWNCLLLLIFNLLVFVSFLANPGTTYSLTVPELFCLSFGIYEFIDQGRAEKNISILSSVLGALLFVVYFAFVYRAALLHPQLTSATRIGAIFGNQNDVARFLAFSLFLFAYFVLFQKCFLSLVPFLLSAYCLLLTGSISNILVVILVLFSALLFAVPKGKIWIVFCSGAIAIVAAYVLLQLPSMAYFRTRISNMIMGLFGSSAGDESAGDRLSAAIQGLFLGLEKPLFGWGFRAESRFSQNGIMTHNNIAEIFADFGFLALLVEEAYLLLPFFFARGKKKEDVGFVILMCGYIFLFQFFLVSFQAKMESIMLPFAYSISIPDVFEISLNRRKKQ